MSGVSETRLRVCLALLATAIAPASGLAADCPVAEDLKNGIVAEFADGGTVEYRGSVNGEVEIFEPDEPGGAAGYFFVSQVGLYDLQISWKEGSEVDPDRSLLITYSAPVETLPVPKAGEVWLGAVRTTFPDGGFETDTAVYVFGNDSLRTLQGCDYPTVPVKASFLGPQDWVAQYFIYFSDLGIAVPTARLESNSERPDGRALAGLRPAGG